MDTCVPPLRVCHRTTSAAHAPAWGRGRTAAKRGGAEKSASKICLVLKHKSCHYCLSPWHFRPTACRRPCRPQRAARSSVASTAACTCIVHTPYIQSLGPLAGSSHCWTSAKRTATMQGGVCAFRFYQHSPASHAAWVAYSGVLAWHTGMHWHRNTACNMQCNRLTQSSHSVLASLPPLSMASR